MHFPFLFIYKVTFETRTTHQPAHTFFFLEAQTQIDRDEHTVKYLATTAEQLRNSTWFMLNIRNCASY